MSRGYNSLKENRDGTKKKRIRPFYWLLISENLTLNLKSVNRWPSCHVFPFETASPSSQFENGSFSREEAVFNLFFLPLLITLQCLHLSVRQPELMELSADRQTACCQLCSVQPDNTAQCISSSEMDDWTARLYCRVEVCIRASVRVCSLVRIFAHFCVCLSICGLFPLLTTEINMLSYKSKQNRWRHIENIYKEHQY